MLFESILAHAIADHGPCLENLVGAGVINNYLLDSNEVYSLSYITDVSFK